MQGKARPFGKKGGKKGAAPKGLSRKGGEAVKPDLADGDPQDETSYVDPAELQRLMQGKARPFGKKGGKKGAAPKGLSRKGGEAVKPDLADGDPQDETSYVDPAELQRLMQGKARPFGKKGGKKGAAPKEPSLKGDEAEKTGSDDGDSQDETSYVDPAELQRLMKNKAKSPWLNRGGLR